MGACYSKHPESSHDHKPTHFFGSKRNRKKNVDNVAPETAPLTTEDADSDKLLPLEKDCLPSDKSTNNVVSHNISRSSTPDLIPEDINPKKEDGGVAPSDSGIESIGIAPEEIQENAVSSTEQDELTKRLERLSRGSCSRCGNFKLDDSAFTALLADTYCSCGPRLAGRASVNNQCKTHSLKKQVSEVDDESEGRPSSLRKTGDGQNCKSVRISVQSAETLSSAICDPDLYTHSDLLDFFQAPLAHFDSVDTFDNSVQGKLKRRSLLSEILNITDSICRCDFYSNEYCCSQTNDQVDVSTSQVKNCSQGSLDNIVSQSNELSPSPVLAEAQSSSDPSQSPNELMLPSRNIKSASLPKNVSFAAHGLIETETLVGPRMSGEFLAPFETCVSETSSGIFTHTSTSDPYLSKMTVKGNPKRTLSLNSRGVLLSDSSSEVLNNFTEEDIVSLDLDSVASVSHGSLRHLIDSMEDLNPSLKGMQRMMVDGVDYLLLPKEVYNQIQADLSNLKQLLVCLSSLIQQDQEN